ncbi:MAG: lysophospholipid acyltransferase family protein [Phycisphaerales bacterium JB040]
MARPVRPQTAGGKLLDQAKYQAIRAGLLLPQMAGLEVSSGVARSIGRAFGASPINARRVGRAMERLEVALPELDDERRRELVLTSYEHLATLAVELSLSSRLLSEEGWIRHAEVSPIAGYLRSMLREGPVILVTGHCGNWEVVGYTLGMLGFPLSAVYRPLDLEPMDRWVRQVRARRGLRLIDKFEAMREMPKVLREGGLVAIVADQNAGDRGLHVPFFNRLASTYKSVGLMAMEFNAPVLVGQAVRTGRPGAPGTMGYRIEMEDQIHPEDWADRPDPLFYITARYRHALERMIRRAPEQYLWMHRIWKSRPRHERLDQPFPRALREKLATLPWLDESAVRGLVERSDKDRAWLRAHQTDRLP